MALPLLNFPSNLNVVGFVDLVENIKGPGSRSLSWGVDQVEQVWQGSRQYQTQMRVITTNAFVTPIQIAFALGGVCGAVLGNYYISPLPELSLNAVVPTSQDTGSRLQNIAIEEEAEDGLSWIATLSYGPFDIAHELGTSNAQYGSFTPFDFPPVVKWSTAKYHRSYPTDVTGQPFVNTAGDPLENPPVREESTQCLRIILWNSSYDEPFAQSFRDTINGDTFLGFGPEFVKCRDIDGERLYTTDYGYVWRIVYDFEIRRIAITFKGVTTIYGWVEPVLNLGYRSFQPAAGNGPQPIIIGGQQITAPVILNQDGTFTPPANRAALVANFPGNQQLFVVFQNYPTSTFANLNIDQDILTANQ